MKRFISIILILTLVATAVLSGCAQRGQAGGDAVSLALSSEIQNWEGTDGVSAAALLGSMKKAQDKGGKLSIVCTTFPQYDWVRQIVGDSTDRVDLTLLLNSRIDLHSYQPSVGDIVRISECDLFIYVGGESDGWVEDILERVVNDDMIVINMIETIGDSAKIEEVIEGMEKDSHDGDGDGNIGDADDDGHGGDGDDEHDEEYDEHVWLSLKNAQILCAVIAYVISALDVEYAETYQNNATGYIEKLDSLDSEYQKAVSSAPVKTLLFGDRFPFRYLVDDYGIGYYAAFSGCSAETEASFDTIIFLTEKVDELGLKSIMVTESSDKRLAETIIRESNLGNQQILVLDAMQSVTISGETSGTTYLSIMESNLDTIKEALSYG